MTVNQGLRMIAGVFVLASVALGVWVSPWFLAFTAFVGLNLLQSAITRWCPMMWVLQKAGLRDDERPEPDGRTTRAAAGPGL
jgi:hypothetical protein